MIFGLTSLGVVHTAISLVAVAAGVAALVRYREISPRNLTGQVYVVATVLTGAALQARRLHSRPSP
jgi:hypothetical protein